MRKRAKLLVAASVVLVTAGAVAWRVQANRVPKTTASRSDLQQFIGSDRFKELPATQQSQYADAMLSKGVFLGGDGQPDEQTMAAMRNAASAHRKQMLDEYFKLKSKERLDYLDKQIDEQERVRKMIENLPATQPNGNAGAVKIVMKGPGGAAGQKQMMESIPADQQAAMAQYMKDLSDRRKERGLAPLGGPGGGGMIIIRHGELPHN